MQPRYRRFGDGDCSGCCCCCCCGCCCGCWRSGAAFSCCGRIWPAGCCVPSGALGGATETPALPLLLSWNFATSSHTLPWLGCVLAVLAASFIDRPEIA